MRKAIKLIQLLLVLVYSQVVYTQSLAQLEASLPSCSISCINNAAEASGCGQGDLHCICDNQAGAGNTESSLVSSAVICVQNSCGLIDTAKTLSAIGGICLQVLSGTSISGSSTQASGTAGGTSDGSKASRTTSSRSSSQINTTTESASSSSSSTVAACCEASSEITITLAQSSSSPAPAPVPVVTSVVTSYKSTSGVVATSTSYFSSSSSSYSSSVAASSSPLSTSTIISETTSLTSSQTSATSSEPIPPATLAADSSKGSGLSAGSIAAIVFAILFVVLLLALSCLCWCCSLPFRRRKKKKRDAKKGKGRRPTTWAERNGQIRPSDRVYDYDERGNRTTNEMVENPLPPQPGYPPSGRGPGPTPGRTIAGDPTRPGGPYPPPRRGGYDGIPVIPVPVVIPSAGRPPRERPIPDDGEPTAPPPGSRRQGRGSPRMTGARHGSRTPQFDVPEGSETETGSLDSSGTPLRSSADEAIHTGTRSRSRSRRSPYDSRRPPPRRPPPPESYTESTISSSTASSSSGSPERPAQPEKKSKRTRNLGILGAAGAAAAALAATGIKRARDSLRVPTTPDDVEAYPSSAASGRRRTSRERRSGNRRSHSMSSTSTARPPPTEIESVSEDHSSPMYTEDELGNLIPVVAEGESESTLSSSTSTLMPGDSGSQQGGPKRRPAPPPPGPASSRRRRVSRESSDSASSSQTTITEDIIPEGSGEPSTSRSRSQSQSQSHSQSQSRSDDEDTSTSSVVRNARMMYFKKSRAARREGEGGRIVEEVEEVEEEEEEEGGQYEPGQLESDVLESESGSTEFEEDLEAAGGSKRVRFTNKRRPGRKSGRDESD